MFRVKANMINSVTCITPTMSFKSYWPVFCYLWRFLTKVVLIVILDVDWHINVLALIIGEVNTPTFT